MLPHLRDSDGTLPAVHPFGKPYPKASRSGRPVLSSLSSVARSVASQPYYSALVDSSSITRALCCFPHWIGSGLLPSPGVTRLLRYYKPFRHLRSPATSLTGLPLVPSAALPHERRLLLLRTVYVPCVLPSLPRWNRWLRLSFASPAASAFLVIVASRLPHWLFRGLLDVHSRYGPHGPLILQEDLFLKCFRPFVAS